MSSSLVILPEIREQEAKTREAIKSFISAVTANEQERLYDALGKLEILGGLTRAFRRVALLTQVAPELQVAFLKLWMEAGDSIRSNVTDDIVLLNALRVLLPRYNGPSMRLYRGDSALNRRRRTYGVSWSSEAAVADHFAKGLWRTSRGGSVVLRAEATQEAIISAFHSAGPDRFAEAEFLVDRRLLKKVSVIRRYD